MVSARKEAALALGRAAEAQVADRLLRGGCRILARNWRGGGGELDLVVARAQKLRFVEVKARRRDDDFEAVHPAQVRRLTAAAEAWMAEQTQDWWVDAAFVLAVVGPEGSIDWMEDPF